MTSTSPSTSSVTSKRIVLTPKSVNTVTISDQNVTGRSDQLLLGLIPRIQASTVSRLMSSDLSPSAGNSKRLPRPIKPLQELRLYPSQQSSIQFQQQVQFGSSGLGLGLHLQQPLIQWQQPIFLQANSQLQPQGLPQQWTIPGTGSVDVPRLVQIPMAQDQSLPKIGTSANPISIDVHVEFTDIRDQSTSEFGGSEIDPTNYCLMCNKSSVIVPLHSASKSSLLSEAQRILKNLFKILNMKEEPPQENSEIPFCLACLRQTYDLVKAHDELAAVQQKFEQLKSKILMAMVNAFSMRKAFEEDDELSKEFYQSSIIHEKMVNNLTAKPRNPSTLPNFCENMEMEGEDFDGTGAVYNDFNLVNAQVDSTADPCPDIAKLEFCFTGRHGTHRNRRKWETLFNCDETKSGLEKLVPVHLRRIACPICKIKITPLQISRHLTQKHPNRKTDIGMEEKLRSMATDFISGKERKKLLGNKWRALVKSSNNKAKMSVVPMKFRRVNCPVCDKEINMCSLSSHLNIHSGSKPFKCSDCPMSFARLSNLSSHKEKHLVQNAFKSNSYLCDLCENRKLFKSKSRFSRHIVEVHASEIGENEVIYYYNCDSFECNQSYRKMEHFVEHLGSHNSGAVFACPNCEKLFASDQNRDEHMSKLHGSKDLDQTEVQAVLFDCKYCPEMFDSEQGLAAHEPSHAIDFKIEQLTHLCEDCGRCYQSKRLLYMHKLNHRVKQKSPHSQKLSSSNLSRLPTTSRAQLSENSELEAPKIFKKNCQFCDKKFLAKSTMINHLLDTHTYENRVFCYLCQQKFKRISDLEGHIRRHLGQPRKTCTEKCGYCNEELPSILGLREHCVKLHPEEYLKTKPFYCPICWLKMATEEEATVHYSQRHEQFKCRICEKQMSNRFRFEVHMRIHTGEKPFECHLCEKTFTCVSNLNEHVFRHTGEKPFVCHLCSTGFIRKKMLRQHLESVHSVFDENIKFSLNRTSAVLDESCYEIIEVDRDEFEQFEEGDESESSE